MKTIAVLNHKGGVGKTTTAVNLSAGLASLGKRTLAIDLDGQANLSYNLRCDKHPDTIYHALRGDIDHLPIVPVDASGLLYAVPSHLDLGAIEMEVVNEPGKEYFLRDLIDGVKEEFDYVIIDCPPALGFLAFNALTAATDVLIPTEADGFAVKGTIKVRELIGKIQKRINPSLRVLGLLLTKYDQRKNLNKEVSRALERDESTRVIETIIRTNVSLSEASLKRQTIFEYAPKSVGAEDYLALSQLIIKNNE